MNPKKSTNVVSCLPGQDSVLQVLMSNLDPEQFPPFCSTLVLLRDLFSIPPPQVFEQDDQVDQDPQTQSSGKYTTFQNLMITTWIKWLKKINIILFV